MHWLVTPLPYKRFTQLLVISITSIFITLVLCINIVIDPYKEYNLIPHDTYRSNSSSAFPLFKKLKQKPYSLIFGTSTSAPIDKACIGDDVLNFSMSLYGEPERIYYALKTLTAEHISHINKIYYAVEHNVFHDLAVTNTDTDYTSTNDFYLATLTNLQKPKIIASLDWLLKFISQKSDSLINEYGVYIHLRPRVFNMYGYAKTIDFSYSPQQVLYLKKLQHFADQHHIEFIVFRTVTSENFLQRVNMTSLARHYQRILEAVPSFYSLIWLEGISDDVSHFRDPIHPSYEVTKQQMMQLSSPQAESYRITPDNIDAHIAFLTAKLR